MSSRSVRSALAGRGFLLLPAAALAVHELRYRLAYGAEADAALAAQGHGYLDSLAPWLVLLLGFGLGAFVARFATALAGRGDLRPRRSFAALWSLATASLVGIYAAQELLEGIFATGHPAGLEGLYGHGGWWSLAAAVALGAVVAALLRLATAVVEAASRLASRFVRRPPRLTFGRPRSVVLVPGSVLGIGAAGRAPPLT
jgi:hypothetical protein